MYSEVFIKIILCDYYNVRLYSFICIINLFNFSIWICHIDVIEVPNLNNIQWRNAVLLCYTYYSCNLRINTIGFNINVTVLYTAVNVKIVENICFSIHTFLSEYEADPVWLVNINFNIWMKLHTRKIVWGPDRAQLNHIKFSCQLRKKLNSGTKRKNAIRLLRFKIIKWKSYQGAFGCFDVSDSVINRYFNIEYLKQ